jgi:hypothetical protein
MDRRAGKIRSKPSTGKLATINPPPSREPGQDAAWYGVYAAVGDDDRCQTVLARYVEARVH